MTGFLIRRPIAVLMSMLALAVFSIMALTRLPVSLLPDIEVPQIIVRIAYPNHAAAEIENNVLKTIRESLVTLNNIKNIESKAGNEYGQVNLSFEYGSNMALAYIDANEKIDRLITQLPQDLPRPQVIKISTTDIAVLRVQVLPEGKEQLTETSLFAQRVLKKRLEQIDEISLVDINGMQFPALSIQPHRAQMTALGLDEAQLQQAIMQQNQQIAGISVKDGQYRYYLKVSNPLQTASDLERLPLRLADGQVIQLRQVARVEQSIQAREGLHLFAQEEGIVINVHKQARAQLTTLIPKVEESLEQFRKDYPQLRFAITQDQSALLNAGISNLQSSLLYGGVFAFMVLFLFMGNARLPIIIGVSLPLSVLFSFLLFYLFGLSINIISLSGLALGLGMLIDNGIIILDNITRLQTEGKTLFESCVQGVGQVRAALISSMLTTLAVFVPLIFLSGIAGALFFDQALAVGIILSMSLLVAFILLPLLYRLFFERYQSAPKTDTGFYNSILAGYTHLHKLSFKRPLLSFLLIALLIPAAWLISRKLALEGLPPINKKELLLQVQWNESISLDENKNRVLQLLQTFAAQSVNAEADIGISQYLLKTDEPGLQYAEIYLKLHDEADVEGMRRQLQHYFTQRYPQSKADIMPAPDAFEQLFNTAQPWMEARIKSLDKEMLSEADLQKIVTDFTALGAAPYAGMATETLLKLQVDFDKLRQYSIDNTTIQESLRRTFSDYRITELRQFASSIPVNLQTNDFSVEEKLRQNTLRNADGQEYPLSLFVTLHYSNDFKELHADMGGTYQSVKWDTPVKDAEHLISKSTDIAKQHQLAINFKGTWFDNQQNLQELMLILGLSVLLLYFILAAQFESIVQPLIVIATMPLGVSGSLLVLWLAGGSINIMSAIGMIIMLGIMVNDAILKIDTINRLIKEGSSLAEALEHAGAIRLKPIIMTSVTTILALLPILFASGIGADLQKPLVHAVMGGLTIGTFTAIFFIPLMYRMLYTRNELG
jgi:multidrug efflux pump subunit AcrB